MRLTSLEESTSRKAASSEWPSSCPILSRQSGREFPAIFVLVQHSSLVVGLCYDVIGDF